MTAMVNNSRCVSVRLVTLWRGAWYADIDLDPVDSTKPPTGAVTLTMLGATLLGTVDPRDSGRLGAKNRLMIVGGAGGWDKPVTRQDYHNDGGVPSTQVYQAAGAQVGERVNDVSPVFLGVDFARTAGPASRVLGDRDWYVDTAGVTQVSSWPTASLDSSGTILDYAANRQELTISCDALVFPGTTFTDPRFDGTLIARDVEQTVTSEGSRATVWCSAVPVSRLTSALTNMVREFSGRQYLRSYRYRVVAQEGDGRLQLQCVNPSIGAPDLLPLSDWSGMQGDSAEVQLSSECDVRFQEGSPALPIVVGWSPLGKPTTRTVDASVEVKIGPSSSTVSVGAEASSVSIGPAPQPLASGPPVSTLVATAITAGGVFASAVAAATPVTPWELIVAPALIAYISAMTSAYGTAAPIIETTVTKAT